MLGFLGFFFGVFFPRGKEPQLYDGKRDFGLVQDLQEHLSTLYPLERNSRKN